LTDILKKAAASIERYGDNMISKPIQTERLVIRDVTPEDASSIYEIWNNPENDKYMGDPVGSLEEVMDICNEITSSDSYLKVIELHGNHDIIGTCCYGVTSKSDEWGFGYSISKKFWGNGFASEIVKAIIDEGTRNGIVHFISECAAENVASARVMQKNGMTFAYNSTILQPLRKIEYVSEVYKLSI